MILFGAVEKVVTEDNELQVAMAKIAAYQASVACKAISDRQQLSGPLKKLGYKVDYIGSLVSPYVDDSYVPLVS